MILLIAPKNNHFMQVLKFAAFASFSKSCHIYYLPCFLDIEIPSYKISAEKIAKIYENNVFYFLTFIFRSIGIHIFQEKTKECIILQLTNNKNNMRLIETTLLIALLDCSISIAQGYITRLEKCRYTANFSQIQEGKYFQGTIGTNRTGPITRSACSFACLADKSCVFYNHKTDESACELLTSHLGELIERVGWRHVSTDYTNFLYRGPLCQFTQMACYPEKGLHMYVCFDSCESPGYECSKIKSIPNKEYKIEDISSAKTSYPKSNLIDFDKRTYWATETSTLSAFFIIDVGKLYSIYNVRICNRHDIPNEKGFFRVNVSRDKNTWVGCQKAVWMMKDVMYVDMPCVMNGPIVGQYVKVVRSNKQSAFTSLGEVLIYGHL